MGFDPLIILAVIVILAGLLILILTRRQRVKLSLPSGEVVYEDNPESPGRLLYSHRLKVMGKPDVLIQQKTMIIPVEVKTGKTLRREIDLAQKQMDDYIKQKGGESMSKKEQPQQEMKREVSSEEASYLNWRDEFLADSTRRAIYEEEAAKSELWLQLVEARQSAGLTQKQMAERIGVSQAQVARIEKEDYDSYTLTTLRKYVAALGEGFSLEVKIHTPEEHSQEDFHIPMTT